MQVSQRINDAQYLTFMLGTEHFALNITKVKEVLDYTPITRIPRTPDFLKGVINLRGQVVPVIDLRMNLGMEPLEVTTNTCIVIMEVSLEEEEEVVVGALADSVQEVLEIPGAKIEPAPTLGTRLNTDFIVGVGKTDDLFRIILNIDKVMSTDEILMLEEMLEEQPEGEAALSESSA